MINYCKSCRFLVAITICFVLCEFADSSDLSHDLSNKQYTDNELRQLALETGILPAGYEDAFIKKDLEKRDMVIVWILLSQDDKIKIVENIKKEFIKNNVVILKNSIYYVNKINNIIYQSILSRDANFRLDDKIKSLMKLIAVIEGDYDDGRNKKDVLVEYIGEDAANEYKFKYPFEFKSFFGDN